LKKGPPSPTLKGMAEGKGIERLMEIMARLRGEGGCPWDREQTFESLRPFLLEEAYEVAEAIDQRDWKSLKEELGDLLFHIVLANKMIGRHPHVFGDWVVRGPREVELNWSKLKEREKGRRSLLDGIPRALPALMRAHKITKRASKVGFDWRSAQEVMEKVQEELQELKEADLLFSLVNLSRFLGVDPEEALHGACDRFSERFRHIEERLKGGLEEATLEEMDQLWDEAKGR